MLSHPTSPLSARFFLSMLIMSMCICTSGDLLFEAEARTIYVDCDYNSENGGTSWLDAIGLRDVDNIATDGDVVFVKNRTYSYSSPIKINKQVEMYGGFSGSESPSDPEHRDWWNNQTIVRSYSTTAIKTTVSTKIDGFFIEDSVVGMDSAGSTTLVNCVFKGNGYGSNGAAITHWYKEDSLTLINCLIVNNDYTPYEGEIIPSYWYYTAIDLLSKSPLTMINCTIADNDIIGRTGYYGISSSDNLTITNCIIRNKIEKPTGSAHVSYSNIIGGFEGEGNIDTDPKFDPEYKLQANSPCIDTGTASEVLYDIRNLPRPIDIPGIGFDGSVAFDMGAFEYGSSTAPTPTATEAPTLTETPNPTPTVNPNADINEDGKIGPDDLLILQQEWGRSTGE